MTDLGDKAYNVVFGFATALVNSLCEQPPVSAPDNWFAQTGGCSQGSILSAGSYAGFCPACWF